MCSRSTPPRQGDQQRGGADVRQQPPVDDLEDEEAEELHLETPGPSTSKLFKQEKPRSEQLDYPNALPYPTESIEQMDAK